MNKIKPIETTYHGYKFRSRTEARWAVLFDNLGIKWIYEPEGIDINGVYYLPDFYLPESKQFFECKGIMSDGDIRKIEALTSAGYSVSVGFSNMTFHSCAMYHEDDGPHYALCEYGAILGRCKRCGGMWFFAECGGYTCQCCGAYDGHHHIDWLIQDGECELDETDVDDWVWKAITSAKSARFEHGESPIIKRRCAMADERKNDRKEYPGRCSLSVCNAKVH